MNPLTAHRLPLALLLLATGCGPHSPELTEGADDPYYAMTATSINLNACEVVMPLPAIPDPSNGIPSQSDWELLLDPADSSRLLMVGNDPTGLQVTDPQPINLTALDGETGLCPDDGSGPVCSWYELADDYTGYFRVNGPEFIQADLEGSGHFADLGVIYRGPDGVHGIFRDEGDDWWDLRYEVVGIDDLAEVTASSPAALPGSPPNANPGPMSPVGEASSGIKTYNPFGGTAGTCAGSFWCFGDVDQPDGTMTPVDLFALDEGLTVHSVVAHPEDAQRILAAVMIEPGIPAIMSGTLDPTGPGMVPVAAGTTMSTTSFTYMGTDTSTHGGPVQGNAFAAELFPASGGNTVVFAANAGAAGPNSATITIYEEIGGELREQATLTGPTSGCDPNGDGDTSDAVWPCGLGPVEHFRVVSVDDPTDPMLVLYYQIREQDIGPAVGSYAVVVRGSPGSVAPDSATPEYLLPYSYGVELVWLPEADSGNGAFATYFTADGLTLTPELRRCWW